MLWNEVGRQTKRVVICPHYVAIDLLLLAGGFLEGLQAHARAHTQIKWSLRAPSKQRVPRRDLPWGSNAVICPREGFEER